MVRFVCQLPQNEQDIIKEKAIKFLNSIEKDLAFKLDEFGNMNIDNVMNDTISNLENLTIYQ